MQARPSASRILLALAMGVSMAAAAAAQARRPAALDSGARIDEIFARWTAATPGCAVGASVGGRPVLARGYGMADLEHDVRIGPDTVFEAGSVAKQFTAAALLLLAADGKLSLDDPARKYVPELPDYGVPLTIRHMLTHTSGLRDWGSVAAIAGWPRTTRVHTHAHVLEIVARQRALNFLPGTRYSYSNTGYNLAAIIVSRVSGMPFAAFTRTRIFEPLGMARTSWRDDYTRIVKNRAIAYTARDDGYRMLMPFENVHGNGGLLTTVGDLLKWNENFEAPIVGDQAFVRLQQQPSRFDDNRAHSYAFGLVVDGYKGVREVGHSGSTAGYSAYLARYPDQLVSVAVLCNATAPATAFARAVADVYLADRVRPAAPPRPTYALTPADLAGVAGLYKDTATGRPLTITAAGGELRAQTGPALVPSSGTSFVTAAGERWELDGRGGLRVIDRFGTVDTYERVQPARPTAADLQPLAGTYASDEAEAVIEVEVENGSLIVKRRPDARTTLSPLYADAFTGPIGLVIFRRGGAGAVESMSIVQDRVWDMKFTRVMPGRTTR